MLKLENDKKLFSPKLNRTQQLTGGNFAINSKMHSTFLFIFFLSFQQLLSLSNGNIFFSVFGLLSPFSQNALSLSLMHHSLS